MDLACSKNLSCIVLYALYRKALLSGCLLTIEFRV